MSRGFSLYRHLLTYQIYGANTNVGKTIFSTILCKAFTRKKKTWYLKPVSTGPLEEADNYHVSSFVPQAITSCLFQFGEAVSPHLAAAKTRNLNPPPSDKLIVNTILEHLQTYCESAPRGQGVVLVETAGGVNSPTPSGTSQADLYRPLRLPVLLVADMKLGGISSTISAFESLHVRGYDLDSVLVFQDDQYRNNEYFSEYFSKRGIKVTSLPPPPLRRHGSLEDKQELATYYGNVSEMDAVEELITSCHQRHEARIERLESIASRARDTIWFPFTQHQGLIPEKLLTIDSAHGDYFQTLTGLSASKSNGKEATKENRSGILQSTLDGSASWWTQGLGHGSPRLSLAAAYAAGRYGHVMFAGAIHEPALLVAELLLKHLDNPRLRKVFYSDDGSTGMEVAVKMALTTSSKRYGWGKDRGLGVLGLKGSYHGDTIGAMDCSEGSAFNQMVHWYQGRGFWFDFPQVKIKDGEWIVEPPAGKEDIFGPKKAFGSLSDIFSVQRDDSDMKKRYERYIKETLVRCIERENMRFGGLILEPLILGAGGMMFCDPLFQRTLVNAVRSNPEIFGTDPAPIHSDVDWKGLPVIFDEVFTGLYRLGTFTPSSLLNIHPDITVHAKLLTGGLVPLCTTAASDSIYAAFLGDQKSDALLHGHSYTAHAVGCEVARTSLKAMIDMDRGDSWNAFKRDWAEEKFQKSFDPVTAPRVSPDADTKLTKETQPHLWSMWSQSFLRRISQARQVDSVIALGSVLAINMRDDENKGYSSTAASGLQTSLIQRSGIRIGEKLGDYNIHSRVLGNVLYLMMSQTSEIEIVRDVEKRLFDALNI